MRITLSLPHNLKINEFKFMIYLARFSFENFVYSTCFVFGDCVLIKIRDEVHEIRQLG